MSGMENNFSLVGCMEEVPDPRAPYNQKHKILDIIVIAVTAILCGMDTWNEIEDWAKSKRDWLGSFLELPGGIPSHDTINRVFQMIDPEKFHDAFFRWTGAVAGKIEGVVAIDGKTVPRSRDDVIEIIKDSKENPTTAMFANLGYYESYFRTFLKWNAISHLEKNVIVVLRGPV